MPARESSAAVAAPRPRILPRCARRSISTRPGHARIARQSKRALARLPIRRAKGAPGSVAAAAALPKRTRDSEQERGRRNISGLFPLAVPPSGDVPPILVFAFRPLVDLPIRLVLGDAVTFLDAAGELI